MMEDLVNSKQLDTIKHYLKPATRYEAAAEEAVELAHELQKMARILRKENPTPKQYFEVYANVVEEYTDVILSMDAVDINPDNAIYLKKTERWVKRLLDLE